MPEVLKESSKKVSYTEQIDRAKKMIKKIKTNEPLPLLGDEDDWIGKSIVQQMEEDWPQMTSEFRRLQREQYELFLHKQHDYGPGNISVGTQLQTPAEIKLSLTGLWFRINDKVQRVKTLLLNNRESAVDEPLEDAFLDMSNYGIMATIVKNGKWGK